MRTYEVTKVSETVTVTKTREWTFETVRRCCIKNEFFTMGTNAEYRELLNQVELTRPTTEGLYRIAKMIAAKSENRDVEDIMYSLEADAVHKWFDIEES